MTATIAAPVRHSDGDHPSVATIDPGQTAPAPAVAHAVKGACDRIAPAWPLERVVAVNPYLGLSDLTFGEAAALLHRTAGASTTMPADFYLDAVEAGRISHDDLAIALSRQRPGAPADVAAFLETVRRAPAVGADADHVPTVAEVAGTVTGLDWTQLATDRISAWAAAYFDAGQAMWRSSDHRREGLFAAWKEEAAIDRTPEIMGLKGFRRAVRGLPDDPAEATAVAIDELGIPPEALELYLHGLLLRMVGWSSYVARTVWDQQVLGQEDDSLQQFLAVLLGWEVGILRGGARRGVPAAWADAMAGLRAHPAPQPGPGSLHDLVVLQDAFDRAEQRRLIDEFSSVPPAGVGVARQPAVQAVFCIDVRSEVIRRHLEATSDDIDTIGFAGFFGFPIDYVPLAHEQGEAQCPVLLHAGHTVTEAVADPTANDDAVGARRLAHHVRRAWKSFKMGAVSCFSFVGPVGLVYLPKLFTDGRGVTRPVARPDDEGLPSWAAATMGPDVSGIPLADRVGMAEGALRGMSLTDGFAELVLITGHGSTTVNNPFGTGLDCGACGGHTGEANARTAAAILNDPAVRQGLEERGIHVPGSTWFLAALHDTTTDEVTVFDPASAPEGHADLLAALRAHLAEASRRARAERSARLGLADPVTVDDDVIRRSTDWAQTRPEWGLAGCRTFIAAPRTRTAHLDLAGRAFLHSYDWHQDDGFGVLELIMTAPMVVASWISLQYYASTVDNGRFGSGNKTLHNVVGKTGVLEGNAGDLRVGLPWQSVHDGEQFQHEPLRLSVVIEAPISAMNDVLAAHPGVRPLVDNQWLQLLAMDDTGAITHRYSGDLTWEPVAAASSPEPAAALR